MAGSTRPGQFRTDRHFPLWGNSSRNCQPALATEMRRFRTFLSSPRNVEVRPKAVAPVAALSDFSSCAMRCAPRSRCQSAHAQSAPISGLAELQKGAML
jgi:hypothetical protein